MKKLLIALAVIAGCAAPTIANAQFYQHQCRTTCYWVGDYQYCNTSCY
jgi:hypothetical protein